MQNRISRIPAALLLLALVGQAKVREYRAKLLVRKVVVEVAIGGILLADMNDSTSLKISGSLESIPRSYFKIYQYFATLRAHMIL